VKVRRVAHGVSWRLLLTVRDQLLSAPAVAIIRTVDRPPSWHHEQFELRLGRPSMQSEYSVDGAQFRRLDQIGVRDHH
jgi:hypothetical protein